MEIMRRNGDTFHLFLDIFVHPSRRKIVAVAPHYGEDWVPAEHGVDFDRVELFLEGGHRIRGRYIPHRLDSWEPCVLFDFEHPLLEAQLRALDEIPFTVVVGPHRQDFRLRTQPEPPHQIALSLVVKNENRWVRTFLEYYLTCLEADHVYVYDNDTADRETLLEILRPYRQQGRITYIPWPYRWRNHKGEHRAMIGQPPQQAHSLNRFANCRWIGFLDVDELLRLPNKTLPEFLAPFAGVQVDGLSFGIRWFHYKGPLSFDEVADPPLNYFQCRRDPYGRKHQKFIVAPQDVRFLRLHWIEEGKRELPIDDSEIFFHHYSIRPRRFENARKGDDHGITDDYMLRFSKQLSGLSLPPRPPLSNIPKMGRVESAGAPSPGHPERPQTEENWIRHVVSAVEAAETETSRLSGEVLQIPGLCGTYNRHFLNRLCGFAGCRFLEIGSHLGASLCAALYANQTTAVCIDNWSQFGGNRAKLENNLRQFTGGNDVQVIEGDCFKIDLAAFGPFDVFYYDADHGREGTRRALVRYACTLANPAVLVIDDWNWARVRDGTRDALRDLKSSVIFEREILLPQEDLEEMPRHRGRHTWWNGVGIFLLRPPDCL